MFFSYETERQSIENHIYPNCSNNHIILILKPNLLKLCSNIEISIGTVNPLDAKKKEYKFVGGFCLYIFKHKNAYK